MFGGTYDWRILGTFAVLALVFQSGRPPGESEQQVFDPRTGEWVLLDPLAVLPSEGPLAEARDLLAAGRPGRARAVLRAFLRENPDDDQYYEAIFLRGETYFEQKNFWKAAEQYSSVAENTSGELFALANQRTVDVARAFLSGERRLIWGFLPMPAYDEGVELLDQVWQRMPGTRLGELALKLKADYLFDNGDLGLAQDEYAFLIEQYPSGRFVQIAMLRAAEAANAAFPGIKYDSMPLVEAEARYRLLAGTFPVFAEQEQVANRLDGIRQQRAEKDLYIADWYRRTRQPSAAEYYYRLVLADYPETLAAADARTRLRALGGRQDDLEARPVENGVPGAPPREGVVGPGPEQEDGQS